MTAQPVDNHPPNPQPPVENPPPDPQPWAGDQDLRRTLMRERYGPKAR